MRFWASLNQNQTQSTVYTHFNHMNFSSQKKFPSQQRSLLLLPSLWPQSMPNSRLQDPWFQPPQHHHPTATKPKIFKSMTTTTPTQQIENNGIWKPSSNRRSHHWNDAITQSTAKIHRHWQPSTLPSPISPCCFMKPSFDTKVPR